MNNMLQKLITPLLISLLIPANLYAISTQAVQGQSKHAPPSPPGQVGPSNNGSPRSTPGRENSLAKKREITARQQALRLLPELLEQSQGFEELERVRPLKRLLFQT